MASLGLSQSDSKRWYLLIHCFLGVRLATLRIRWVIKLNRFRMVNEHIVVICYVVRDDIFELPGIRLASHEYRALEHLSPIPGTTEANHIVN